MATTDQGIADGKVLLQAILDTLNKVDQATATLQDLQGKISAYQVQAKTASDAADAATTRLNGIDMELQAALQKVHDTCAATEKAAADAHAAKMQAAQAELGKVVSDTQTATVELQTIEADITAKTEEQGKLAVNIQNLQNEQTGIQADLDALKAKHGL